MKYEVIFSDSALKQLKKFVKDQGGCDKTKTVDKPHLSQILLRERVAMR